MGYAVPPQPYPYPPGAAPQGAIPYQVRVRCEPGRQWSEGLVEVCKSAVTVLYRPVPQGAPGFPMPQK